MRWELQVPCKIRWLSTQPLPFLQRFSDNIHPGKMTRMRLRDTLLYEEMESILSKAEGTDILPESPARELSLQMHCVSSF